MEVRKGAFDGPFYNFIDSCAGNPLFGELCPISTERKNRNEGQELILRYFAYADRYLEFAHRVDDFLDDYMKDKHEHGFDEAVMRTQYEQMLGFVQTYFPNGFKKSATSKSTPRVRFEAISVGVTLASRIRPDLVPANVTGWLSSNDFKGHTTSDAANSRAKVIGRVEYVRDRLLGI
jgi:hypothetical protein